MTMQRDRNPLNPASAAARAISLVGCEAIADAVDKSPSTIRGWADEERPDSPNMWQAMAVDQLCLEKADEAPFAAFLDRWRESNAGTNEDAVVSSARAAETATSLVSEVIAATSPNSENGKGWSPNEKARALRKLADAQEELDRAQRAILKG